MNLGLVVLLVVMLAAVSLTANDSFADTACKYEYELVYKTSTDSPYCVKPATAEKLVLRGWGYQAALPEERPPEMQFDNIIDANNQLATNLYLQVAKDPQDNVFFSPWSISSAFAIAYEGARADTAEQMQHVFGFPENDKIIF